MGDLNARLSEATAASVAGAASRGGENNVYEVHALSSFSCLLRFES